MPELQKLYETILGKKLSRGNFYRKMKRYNILNKLDETEKVVLTKHPIFTVLIKRATIELSKMGCRKAGNTIF